LNGSWEFRFEENKSMVQTEGTAFTATDRMAVPGCYDMMPRWLCKRGTGLYRRTFTLAEGVANAWLVIDGMGLVGNFQIDGKDLGTHPYPYARLELETGPLAAGTHTVFAALDNRFDWEQLRLARPYYDFYCFGGFYHGVSLVFDNRKLFVRTRDYKTGTVEVEAVAFASGDFDATLLFDGKNTVPATFKNGRATVRVPAFKLWSPSTPNLHTVALKTPGASAVEARFGIREIKAEHKRLWLNGETLYLKGANRHESHPQFGAATPDALMIEDIQNLKSLGGNFFRGCHYQQSQRFLDYCDEMGVLVWEESLGWGNKGELSDAKFIADQLAQTRAMVRSSFNHPSVIIFAFMNEFLSSSTDGKALADQLIAAIKAEDSGRLVTYACCHNHTDIANENTDVIAFNTYPGWIGSDAGTPENLRALVTADVNRVTDRFRKLYPEKPILVSEMGTCGVYGHHDPAGAQWTEEFEAEYDGDVIDAVFANPEITGLALWQFTDARSYHRGGANIRSKPFAQNLAGLYDGFRRPKAVVPVVKAGFARTAAGEGPAK
jgi:beta-glucuronidase